MALKRKRSISSISPPSVACSFSPPATHALLTGPSPFAQSPNHEVFMSNQQYSPNYSDNSPSHLHSRTRKRFRSRPDESTVHETTYQILFAAARSPPLSNPSTSPPPSAATIASVQNCSQKSGRQSSLHAFWALPTPPSSAPRTPPPHPLPQSYPSAPPTCQDCDSFLLSASDIDTCMSGMDDANENGEFACRACGRMVCGTCAVVEVGVGRECLSCKTQVRSSGKETWIGGIGWMP